MTGVTFSTCFARYNRKANSCTRTHTRTGPRMQINSSSLFYSIRCANMWKCVFYCTATVLVPVLAQKECLDYLAITKCVKDIREGRDLDTLLQTIWLPLEGQKKLVHSISKFKVMEPLSMAHLRRILRSSRSTAALAIHDRFREPEKKEPIRVRFEPTINQSTITTRFGFL